MTTNPAFDQIDVLSRNLYAREHDATSLDDSKLKLVWDTLSEETRMLYQTAACLEYIQSFTDNLPRQIHEYLCNLRTPTRRPWNVLGDYEKAFYGDLVKDLGLLSYSTPATMEAAPSLPKGIE